MRLPRPLPGGRSSGNGPLRLPSALLAAAAVCLAAPVGSCGRSSSNPQASQAGADLRKDVYTVRGIIEQVPDPAKPGAEFQVRHEAIPHFRQGGSKLGMQAMIMPFPLAEGLSLEGFKKGDRIELTFEVDFDTSIDRLVGYRATAIKALPADTVLHFSLDATPPTPPNPESTKGN